MNILDFTQTGQTFICFIQLVTEEKGQMLLCVLIHDITDFALHNTSIYKYTI